MSDVQTPSIEPPSPFASRYARRILGFGVWFVLGLAPFLGKVRVPGFSQLLEMYPADLSGWLIPVSGLLMGMMAVTVEFAASRFIGQPTLTRWFIGTVALFAVLLITLTALYPFLVTRVEFTLAPASDGQPPGRTTVAFVTGALTVPQHPPGSDCKCPEGQPADQCIAEVSLNPVNVRRCFGAQRVAIATLAFALLYLSLTGSFAAAVGLLMLSQRRARSSSGTAGVRDTAEAWTDDHGIARSTTDVFVSYSRSDLERVHEIMKQLKAEGLTVFSDQDILPGQSYDDFLNKALEHSRLVLVVWSQRSVTSDWVRAEAEYARSRKRLVSCRVEECTPRVPFNTFQTADLCDWKGDPKAPSWRQVIDLIVHRVRDGDAKTPLGSVAAESNERSGT